MKKILLAFDGGESARRALETAASLAEAFGAELAVVSVVPGNLASGASLERAAEQARNLQEARHFLADRGLDADLLEPAGDPACKIEQIAEEGGFDTIVVGSRNPDGSTRPVGGSVSTHVATHANATVVVTR